MLDDVRACFEPDAPIADRATLTDKGHGRLTSRKVRTSQLLHGYSDFPDLHTCIEIDRTTVEVKSGKVTSATAYAVTSMSPRRFTARGGAAIVRGHWSIETRNNFVRDDGWREDRQVWRRGNASCVMNMLLGVALNLLRCNSPHWTNETPMTHKAAIVNDNSITPAPLIGRAL